jgi:hypothetical protein
VFFLQISGCDCVPDEKITLEAPVLRYLTLFEYVLPLVAFAQGAPQLETLDLDVSTQRDTVAAWPPDLLAALDTGTILTNLRQFTAISTRTRACETHFAHISRVSRFAAVPYYAVQHLPRTLTHLSILMTLGRHEDYGCERLTVATMLRLFPALVSLTVRSPARPLAPLRI